jgi:hypothetical protein
MGALTNDSCAVKASTAIRRENRMRLFFIFLTSGKGLSLRRNLNFSEAWTESDSKQVVSNSRARGLSDERNFNPLSDKQQSFFGIAPHAARQSLAAANEFNEAAGFARGL